MITSDQSIVAALTFEDLLELRSIMYYVKEMAALKLLEPCQTTEDAERWFKLLGKCITDHIDRRL